LTGKRRWRSRLRCPARVGRSDTKSVFEASIQHKRALETRRILGEYLVLGLLDSSVAARALLLALEVDPIALRRTLLRALADAG